MANVILFGIYILGQSVLPTVLPSCGFRVHEVLAAAYHSLFWFAIRLDVFVLHQEPCSKMLKSGDGAKARCQ